MTAPTTGTALDTGALRAMLAAATPGPWADHWPDPDGCDGDVVVARGEREVISEWHVNGRDAALIAAAVNNLEALLDAADERAALRATVETVCNNTITPPWIRSFLRAALAGPNPRGGQDGGGE